MALGSLFNKRTNAAGDAPPLVNAPEDAKPRHDESGYSGETPPAYDPENLGPGGRKMSRIDGPVTKPKIGRAHV